MKLFALVLVTPYTGLGECNLGMFYNHDTEDTNEQQTNQKPHTIFQAQDNIAEYRPRDSQWQNRAFVRVLPLDLAAFHVFDH